MRWRNIFHSLLKRLISVFPTSSSSWPAWSQTATRSLATHWPFWISDIVKNMILRLCMLLTNIYTGERRSFTRRSLNSFNRPCFSSNISQNRKPPSGWSLEAVGLFFRAHTFHRAPTPSRNGKLKFIPPVKAAWIPFIFNIYPIYNQSGIEYSAVFKDWCTIIKRAGSWDGGWKLNASMQWFALLLSPTETIRQSLTPWT